MNAPRVDGVLETVLYCRGSEFEEMERFYSDALGLKRVFDKHPVAYRLGAGVLLIFNADESRVQDDPPPHGARGSVHACFVTTPEAYEEWKTYLPARGIEIKSEIRWPGQRRSFYFEDPAGNLLEMADGDFWPR